VALLLATATTLGLVACGGNSSESTQSAAQQAGGQQSGGGGGQKPLPADAPISATLARQFPKPKVQPNAAPGSQQAINAGRKACRGKTPIQVRDEFIAEAEAGGLLNSGQKKMLAEIDQFEKQAATSPDFVAGQLAAGVYEATLPETLRIAGYQGCVYELAQQLQKEIAKKK
jgi:hypothetical protein